MKINVITVCKNEERVLPFFLQHYSEFCDSIMLYEGSSDDRSMEIIGQYPKAKAVRVTPDDELDDGRLLTYKNEYYKEFRNEYDWQIICDVDELLYCEDLLGTLERYKAEGVTVPKIAGYQMGSTVFPEYGVPLVKQLTRGTRDYLYLTKNIIFNPAKVDMRYNMGCHTCQTSGEVKFSEKEDLKLLHYRYLSYGHMIGKSTWASHRLSEFNRRYGFGEHYSKLAKMTEPEYNKMVTEMETVV